MRTLSPFYTAVIKGLFLQSQDLLRPPFKDSPWLPSKFSPCTLISAVAFSELELEHLRPLLNVALRQLHTTLTWDSINHAVTETSLSHRPISPPFQQTLWLRNMALQLEAGTFWVGLHYARETIFGVLASLETAFETVSKRWKAGSNSVQKSIHDTMLDLEVGPDDAYYRLQRDDNDGKRVVYVHVTDISILPEFSRTCGLLLIRDLSKLSGWYDKWNTLTVSRRGDEIQCLQDQLPLPGLPPEKVVAGYPFFNVLNLRVLSRKKCRVTYVDNGSELCYLKIARCSYELRFLFREFEAIHALAEKKSPLGPELLGYAYEEPQHRVIGFLLKEIPGRPACISDKEDCMEALRELHASGVVHGDLVKYNILITSGGPRFIDFENSSLRPHIDLESWNTITQQELCNLEPSLLDSSGKGKPWNRPWEA